MRIAQKDLGLDVLYVVYPGARRYALAAGIEAVPLDALLKSRENPRRHRRRPSRP